MCEHRLVPLHAAVVRKALDLRPIIHPRAAQEIEDLQQLVILVRPAEDGLPQDELAQNAPNGPDVQAEGVHGRSQKQLRRSIPERDDVGGDATERVAHQAHQSEIGHLQSALVGIEQVGRLQIPVDHPVAV